MENSVSNGSPVENDSAVGSSPLHHFTLAKQSLTRCFSEIDSLCEDTSGFLAGLTLCNPPIQCELPVAMHLQRVRAILKIISRNNMKVVFFGRTSNGKSTVINSMLRGQILPAGLGHTTNCFLEISGTDKSQSFFTLHGSDKIYPIKELNKFNSQDSDCRVNVNELIEIKWPKQGCDFLKDDIVLIDSPGIDVSANLDSWIEKHCMDADVFVLVSNAESVLSRTEKNFFFLVREKLSYPNIFILNNRWDATADEADGGAKLRKTHADMEINFLCDELKVCGSHEEAQNRIYFVSAKEALADRISTDDHPLRMSEGLESRLEEFADFEKEFTSCLSKSAVQTKFHPHAEQGIKICEEIQLFLDRLFTECSQREQNISNRYDEASRDVEMIEQKLQELTSVVKNKIRKVVSSVEHEVGLALESEIQILSELIEKFDHPFHPDAEQLEWYKKELHTFVEKKLGENMSSRLGAALLTTLESVQSDIRGEILKMVPECKWKDIKSVMSRTDFSVAYRFYCSNLCADFKEDIAFKFSLSPAAIFHKILQLFNPTSVESENQSSFNEELAHSAKLFLPSLAAFSSANAMVVLTASSIIWKGIGWRLLVICSSAYALFFAYERLMWTKRAQEIEFKRQYVNFASNKLHMMIELTSGNASHQVQEELSLFFAQMCKFVDESKDDRLDEMRKLNQEKTLWMSIGKKTSKLREKTKTALHHILAFTKDFLEP